MVKSGLAAGLSWWIAGLVTGVPDPVLAPLTAIVVVQVSVRSSVRKAIERSVAVVLGVLLALAIGDALEWNAVTVAVLVVVSLGVAELVLRLPSAAARQVPISGLVVLTDSVVEPRELRLAAGSRHGHRRGGRGCRLPRAACVTAGGRSPDPRALGNQRR